MTELTLHRKGRRKKRTQEGVNFMQQRAVEPLQSGQQHQKQVAWACFKGGHAQKVAIEAPKDKAKEHAKRDTQVAPKAAKPLSCLH